MAINWTKLENDIDAYMKTGAGDITRTPLHVANKIETLYIREVLSNGREQYNNWVNYLPAGFFAATLAASMIACLGVVSSVDPAKLAEDNIKKKLGNVPPSPVLPLGMPSTGVSIPQPPLAGLPSANLSLHIPMIPSASEEENKVRKIMSLEPLPATPSAPAVSTSDLLQLVSPPAGPPIPDTTKAQAKVASSVARLSNAKREQYNKMAKRVADSTTLPPLPVADTPESLGIKVPVIPADSNLLKLNASGTNGVIITWMSGLMSPIYAPPGMASVVSNKIVSPGTIAPMKSALGGAGFASEIVSSLRVHSKTVTGVVTGVTPNGTPMAVPWVGIS